MSKKRYLAAFGAAGLVFAGVFGAAASLNVAGGAVQSGSDDSLKCDARVVIASYLVDAEPPDPISSGVRITDINDRCEGEELFVHVLDGDENSLARGSSTITAPETSISYDGGATPKVAAIEEVLLTID
ncbi:MAG: hypothetical protein GEV09_20830 [Pseudonocardiaceae bacterium]|nr:hypothetical protein [Pseudonocardiaceae bacterium]